jgi:hypothetical protein
VACALTVNSAQQGKEATIALLSSGDSLGEECITRGNRDCGDGDLCFEKLNAKKYYGRSMRNMRFLIFSLHT